MSSEELGLGSTQNGLNSQLVFQDENMRFNCGAPPQRRVSDSGPKTRELTGFIDDRFFAPQSTDFRRSIFNENSDRREQPEPRNWISNGADTTPSGEGSDEDDDDEDEDDEVDEDDDVDEVDAEVGGLVGVDKRNKGIANNNGNNVEDKMGNGKVKHQQQLHSSFGGTMIVGSSREVLMKDHSVGQQTVNGNNSRASPRDTQAGRLGNYHNAVTVAEPDGDIYYSQYLQGSEGSNSAQKDFIVENGCGFSGRKDVMYLNESGDSLRAILSDPVTGALMDDAMILPCGHSFGGGGMQHVIKMGASKLLYMHCYFANCVCGLAFSEERTC